MQHIPYIISGTATFLSSSLFGKQMKDLLELKTPNYTVYKIKFQHAAP